MCSILGVLGKTVSPRDFAGLLCAHGVARAGHEPLLWRSPAAIWAFSASPSWGWTSAACSLFASAAIHVVCNGELYGFRPLRERLKEKYTFVSESDCEMFAAPLP